MKTPTLAVTFNSDAVSYTMTRASAAFGVLALIGVFLYGTFLLMTVMHAAGRQTAQVQLRAIAAQVGQMQGEYLSKSQSITPDTVATLGFTKPHEVVVVYQAAGATTLSLNTQH
ncbi:MAG: hypothetical protein JWO43_512 [Candidatus Adlerbacteria bacterium]|nr:hypothetical protein [Candidatus Adlerbacteria bacterium]